LSIRGRSHSILGSRSTPPSTMKACSPAAPGGGEDGQNRRGTAYVSCCASTKGGRCRLQRTHSS
jgi:hypothetical protein